VVIIIVVRIVAVCFIVAGSNIIVIAGDTFQ
jgi:hypothetical protein